MKKGFVLDGRFHECPKTIYGWRVRAELPISVQHGYHIHIYHGPAEPLGLEIADFDTFPSGTAFVHVPPCGFWDSTE